MKSDKELYRRLRLLPFDQLWNEEVRRFDQASTRERLQQVAVIRAVGAAMVADRPAAQREAVREWLVALLEDPQEKIRRYAMAAIPKVRGAPGAEERMIHLLKTSPEDRERKHAGRALGKIGGAASLAAAAGLHPHAEQKLKASLARSAQPGSIRMDRRLNADARMRIHLRCRKGLEPFVLEELEELNARRPKFKMLEVRSRYVAVCPIEPFSLSDLYTLRCFSTVGFSLGLAREATPDAVAALVASARARNLLRALTDGAIRYRLEFVSKGHQRGAVREIAARVFAKHPELLNDPHRALWSMDVHNIPRGAFVELRPRLYPDPRLWYRLDDVPASSHPPLAACMARLAGPMRDEVIWDPFCGSGLELIECALRGGVRRVIGTDVDAKAVRIAQANIGAARLGNVEAQLVCVDFQNRDRVEALRPGGVTLMVTNPPMGRRVRIPDLRGLMLELLRAASTVLAPGGRLVFVNPVRLEVRDPSLRLARREVVDLGGFSAYLEKYEKLRAAREPALSERAKSTRKSIYAKTTLPHSQRKRRMIG